jgi:nondiscriminating glutamyl-tRNA synthetase
VLPTAEAHAGLMSWLFARSRGGVWVLRVEDAEGTAVSADAERGIYVSLKWLGLRWDEGPVSWERFSLSGPGAHGPYRQSERLAIYEHYLEELKERDLAYPCFCSPEELERERRERARQGRPAVYSGKCAHLPERERAARLGSGRRPVWRLRAGHGEARWQDLVRGEMAVPVETMGDFTLVFANGRPSPALAAVIDDHLMEITHVITRHERLPLAPRQLLLHRALGFDPPAFGHLPLLTGPDHKPLAPRHGLSTLDNLFQQGFLAPAVVNYLARLGWSPGPEQQIMSLSQMAEAFDLGRVSKSPAVFDAAKLKWINGLTLRSLPPDRLLAGLAPYLAAAGWAVECYDPEWLAQAVETVRERITVCGDAVEELRVYLEDDLVREEEAEARLRETDSRKPLTMLRAKIGAAPALTAETAAELLRSVAQESGRSGRELFPLVRAALFGRVHGPDLALMIAALGKERALRRLQEALQGEGN